MPRHLADHLENIDHRGASTNNPVEFQIVEELLLQCANTFAAMKRVGKHVQGFLEPRAVYGLGYLVIGAAFYGRNGVVQRVEPAHQDYVHAWVMLQRLFQELEAIHTRHLDVRHHNAHSPLVNHFERVMRIARANGGETEAAKRLLQHLDHDLLVVQHTYRKCIFRTSKDQMSLLGGRCHGVHARIMGKANATIEVWLGPKRHGRWGSSKLRLKLCNSIAGN